MATKTFFFKGITKWAKVRQPDELYNNYQVPLYMDADSKKAFKASGSRLNPKTDEGGEYVTFKKPHVFIRPWDGTDAGGPPEVHIWNPKTKEYEPFEGLIGNGSEITVKAEVYDSRNGKGTRLVGVGIDKLVVYEKSAETAAELMPF